MIIIDEAGIRQSGIDWQKSIAVIDEAVACLDAGDFAQPVKPYLRYRDRKNRIIAMPAFAGGNINMAGIKWIASFPGNIDRGIPRAHCVVILNDPDTGKPLCVIDTALISIIRTASVSGLVIRYYERARPMANVQLGIAGFGPIGQHHLAMCRALLGERLTKVRIFDIRPIPEAVLRQAGDVEVVRGWEDAYADADLFITCTVSEKRYIDTSPKPGSLHLNVSLRDYTAAACHWFKGAIVVDDWEEVCRENTDIEIMHIQEGLQQTDTFSITDVARRGCLMDIPVDRPVMFNPMGMAVFDIAISEFYYRAKRNGSVYEQTIKEGRC